MKDGRASEEVPPAHSRARSPPCCEAAKPADHDPARTGDLRGTPASTRRAAPRRPAPPVATVSITAVQDLDVIVESAECSCDAGDDIPR
ncbi:hypothetical protein [Streptomyces sp. CB03238]|uniref:hypothetical protein n=1 Tax=Streptomyces sp. CB03238 TaxID=1907777 RepID=UPI0015C47937|nr:hypothetical protein [Streptomyces sp. CB03238]